MNVYIFNEIRLGAVYGVGTYIRELSAALKKSDINIFVVNLNSGKPHIKYEEIDGVLQLYFPSPIQWSKELPAHWDLYHYNVVYWLQLHIKDKKNLIFHLNYNQKSGLAVALKGAFDCRIVLTVHFLDWCFKLLGNSTRFRKILETQQIQGNREIEQIKETVQIEKEIFQIADCIICLSKNTRLFLQEYYQIKQDKIVIVYNGLTDAGVIVEKKELRQKYNLPFDVPIFLFVGRVDEIKGLKYILRAFRIVLNACPYCRLFIIGNGHFDSHLKECEDIWSNIVWTGLINKEKLSELYAIADIGVMPSFHEQCSYVAIEMMMHGLPIIASTSTGLKEMVEDSVSGLHIPVVECADRTEIDSSLLAEKMLYLLKHPLETKRMGENGRKRYLNNYSSEIFRINMVKTYNSLFQ